MEFVVITGVSGAGKTVAMRAMEDIGFYCLDNIPPQLLIPFYDLCLQSKDNFQRVVAVTDIRTGSLELLYDTMETMRQMGKPLKILFLDADRKVRMNRYKETRRRHPLLDDDTFSIEDAMEKEEALLRPILEIADYRIDSSYMRPTQLHNQVVGLFLGDDKDAMAITCISFGFKHGVPPEADLVFDVRCLPNPFYEPELKQLTGLDAPVRDYVFQSDHTEALLSRMKDWVDYTLPLYEQEGKTQLHIAIGCTGGHHRSVALAQALHDHLQQNHNRVRVNHRDIHR